MNTATQSRKETMSPRERVLKAINHEIPDRVPIDLGGNQTGIHRFAYEALLEHLGIRDDVTIMDAVQQLAKPCEAVLERFHVDTRYIAAGGPDSFKGGIEQNRRDGRLWHDLRDEFGVVWSMPDDHPYYMDISHHPLANATLADIAKFPFPKGDDPTRFAGLRERALKIRNETPYAVVSGISGVVYEICWYMRGLERWFMDLLDRSRVLRGPARPDAEVLARLVPPVPRRGGRRGRRDHDRRRPGRAKGPAVSAGNLPRDRQAAAEAARAVHPLAHEGEDLVSHLRQLQRVHSRLDRQRRRYSQPGADQREGHGPGGVEVAVRRQDGASGAAASTPSTSCRRPRRQRSASTFAATSRR